MKKEIETINKGQEEIMNITFELKNTHSRSNQKQARRSRGSDQRAGGQGRKKIPERARKGKEAQKE